jgi:hypothetical protein
LSYGSQSSSAKCRPGRKTDLCSRAQGIRGSEGDFNAQSAQLREEGLVILSQNRSNGAGFTIAGHGYVIQWVDNGLFQVPLADFYQELLRTHFARYQLEDIQAGQQAKRNRHEAGEYDARFLGGRYVNLLQYIGRAQTDFTRDFVTKCLGIAAQPWQNHFAV